MMTLKNPSKLRERDTGYGFLKFWNTFTSEDRESGGYNDGGSVSHWQTTKTLDGLWGVACFYVFARGNSFYQVNLRELVKYVSENDMVFAVRMTGKSLPNLLVRDWINRVYKGDKKLMAQLVKAQLGVR